ncbi:MAG: site-2 protease family protein [Phycisphaerae bacterium]
MFGKTFRLFSLFGFEVKIDLSWLIIIALVVWSLSAAVFPDQYPNLSNWAYLAMGLGGAAGLFVSIVFHELCHSLVARRYGLPMKGITLFIFGGVAEMSEEPPSAKAEFMMAIAGPLSSVLLAGVAFGASALVMFAEGPKTVAGVLGWIALINAILVAFNLIPGFPLDGGRVLRSVLWQIKGDLRWATSAASRVGATFGLVLIGLGFVTLLFGSALGGLWWIFIGMFLRAAAKQGYQQVIIREALKGEPVRRFMNDNPVYVTPSTPLERLVEDYVYRLHFKMFPVVDETGRLAGCVTTRHVSDVPRDRWPATTVGDIIEPCSEDNTISADTDAVHALSHMSSSGASRMMVVENGELAGMLSLKDLMDFLSLKLELESESKRAHPPELPTE